jgi:OFA family oxalate/formate antiporter-like MFS transporter
MLYTAKGAGALLVPAAALISKAHGWAPVFTLAMTFNVIAALLALFVLKPMRVRHFARSREAYPADSVPRARTT